MNKFKWGNAEDPSYILCSTAVCSPTLEIRLVIWAKPFALGDTTKAIEVADKGTKVGTTFKNAGRLFHDNHRRGLLRAGETEKGEALWEISLNTPKNIYYTYLLWIANLNMGSTTPWG